jgi:NAD(P)H-hydrate epimerase
MFIPLPTPEEMGGWDRAAIHDLGIRGEILMENASREAMHVLQHVRGPLRGKRAVLLAGSGNNGGDAFALARHLNDLGANCLILHTRALDAYKGETAYHLELARRCGIAFQRLADVDPDRLAGADVLVDGLLGTGFQGELRQDYLEWIRRINAARDRSFVLAIDIPSGLNGYSGRPSPEAVRAHCTVTFEASKTGLWMPEAAEHVGDLHVRSIGIPRTVRESNPPGCLGLDREVFRYLTRPRNVQHKGSSGHLLVVGGSPGLTGAPTLAALGGLRGGAGLVTVACPRSLGLEIKQGWPDVMTLPLGPGKHWSQACFEELQGELGRFDAVVLGPGLGRQEGAQEFLRTYLAAEHPPTVLDADALFWLAGDRSLCEMLGPSSVLTPHPGEMARLLDADTAEIVADRLDAARRLAGEAGCTAALKGAGTAVAAPGEPVRLSPIACANLAVGGSGDVLAGLIGRLLAGGIPPLQAACLGVYWHGLAGLRLQRRYPERGNLAQDIAHALPHVRINAAGDEGNP